ncbi:hypothetical protein FRC01_008709, partial [Tulasnella sp. 417]
MSTTRRTPSRGRSLSVSATSRRQPRKPPSFISKSFIHRTSFKFDPPQAANNAGRIPADLVASCTPIPQRQPSGTAGKSAGERCIYLTNSASLLPASLEPLDIPVTATHFSLDGLRDAFLSNLSDLQARLSRLAEESKADECLEQEMDPFVSPSNIEDILEEGAALVREGVEFVAWLKEEMGAHMPELDFDFDFDFDFDNAIAGVRSHLPDVKSHLPDFDFEFKVRERVNNTMDDARERFRHLDLHLPSFPNTQEYQDRLQTRLTSIREYLQAVSLPSPTQISLPSLPTPKTLTNLLPDILGPEEDETERALRARAAEIRRALTASCNGLKLINFNDLPTRWKNNEHVHHGYRFIPFSEWPSLVLSLFALHNETANIHTHLLPFASIILVLAWPSMSIPTHFLPSSLVEALNLSPTLHLPALLPSSPHVEVDWIPKYLFFAAAATCLACSSFWHLTAGCSDLWVIENGARIDYAGIGWLISASVATCVYYGFDCHPNWMIAYIGLTVVTAIAGSVAPFQAWFDERKNKMKRIAFFVGLACSSLVPIIHLGFLKGPSAAWAWV